MPEKRKPLIERRADEVDQKLREWERKLSLAQTKVAFYRKKERYYRKLKYDAVAKRLATLQAGGGKKLRHIEFDEGD